MSKKNEIEILLSATDNASGVLKTTQKAVTDLWEKPNWITKIRTQNKWKITAAAWVTFAWISYYIKQWIEDINEYNYSIKRLEALTKNSTWATKEQVNVLVKHAESLEKVWVATKDNIVAWMSQFATFDMSTEAIDKLTDAFVDYVVAEKWATASSEEYRSMANWLAQALQWNYTSLTKTWFILDEETKALIETWDEMQRVSAIVDVLNSTYKDFNKTASQTAQGQEILLKRSFDDIRETISSWFLPILQKITETLQKVVNSISTWVQAHPKLATSIAGIVTALTWLITVIWAVNMALPAITTAITVLSWPIWIVIAALTALWVAYATNFWWFRDFVNETWQELEPILNELANTIIESFWEIRETIKEVYKQVEPILIPIRNLFKQAVKENLKIVLDLTISSFKAIGDAVEWVTTIFNEIIDFFTNIFSWNRQWALDNLKNITETWIQLISDIFSDFWLDLPAIFETLKTKITETRENLFTSLKDICKWAVDRISEKVTSIQNKINAAKDAITWLWWWWSSWWRASWGQVLAWQTYRVNEIHWEYFTPSVNWIITPTKPINQTPNVNINFWDVNVRDESDIIKIWEIIDERLKAIYSNIYLHNY